MNEPSLRLSPTAGFAGLLASLRWPLVQAPMAGVQGHRLAAAVCQAGALGALPAAMLSPQALWQEVQALRAASAAPYLLNFFCHAVPPPDPPRDAAWRALLAPFAAEWGLADLPEAASPSRLPFDAAAAARLADWPAALRPTVVSFHFGLPAPQLLAQVKALGLAVWSSATTVDEARWLVQHGADAVIAQGLEAGGHRGHFLRDDLQGQAPLAELLPAVRAAVPVPVIAAGGLSSAAHVAAALAAGASACQIGSALLQADEADTSAVHRAALASAGRLSADTKADAGDLTALTRLFSGRPARSLVNRLMRELGPMNPAAPAFPLASVALAPLRAAAEARACDDFSPLWSGVRGPAAQAGAAADILCGLMAADMQSVTAAHEPGTVDSAAVGAKH